jgi:hypothetical protein
MKRDFFSINKLKMGGLFGAVAGTLISSMSHKEYDEPARKAAKTGFFAAIGFLIGNFLENLFRKK